MPPCPTLLRSAALHVTTSEPPFRLLPLRQGPTSHRRWVPAYRLPTTSRLVGTVGMGVTQQHPPLSFQSLGTFFLITPRPPILPPPHGALLPLMAIPSTSTLHHKGFPLPTRPLLQPLPTLSSPGLLLANR